MNTNRINASVPEATVRGIIASIDRIVALLPFLLTLASEQRRQIVKVGERTLAFIDKALEVAVQNPTILPPTFSLPDMQRDVELSRSLRAIGLALMRLEGSLDDTLLVTNGEAYQAALTVYSLVKAQKATSANLGKAAEELRLHFDRVVHKTDAREQTA